MVNTLYITSYFTKIFFYVILYIRVDALLCSQLLGLYPLETKQNKMSTFLYETNLIYVPIFSGKPLTLFLTFICNKNVLVIYYRMANYKTLGSLKQHRQCTTRWQLVMSNLKTAEEQDSTASLLARQLYITQS